MDDEQVNAVNKALMDRVNGEGVIYLTHTKLFGKFALRLAVGQTGTRREHVETAWQVLNSALES
jgi:aromatic-L-amino-acid decarboxylase